MQEQSDPKSEISSNAAYYRALCGLMLFNTNAENLLIEFITNYPESPKVNRAYFDLGKYQYRKRRYKRAVAWLEKVDVYNLSNEQIAEYYFKIGYSYFKEDRNEEALQSLFEIKDTETKYSVVAKYYYAHISYESGNYETSLDYFRQIEHQPSFKTVIPYYIAQILFHQAKYDELIGYAVPILDSALAQREAEIARLIGEAYYETERYEECIPYLKAYLLATPDAKSEDYYKVGEAYDRMEDFENAVRWYQQALSSNDSLNQVIQYHMGQSYLKGKKLLLARNSMKEAYHLGDDVEIRENAMYAYAKLSYELSEYPYNDAVQAFEAYLNTYPDSPNKEEANEFLVNVYFTTRNYEEARKSLDRIENRSLKLNMAYQRILYYLGVEYMNRGEYAHAIAYFDLAIGMEYIREVKNQAYFLESRGFISPAEV